MLDVFKEDKAIKYLKKKNLQHTQRHELDFDNN